MSVLGVEACVVDQVHTAANHITRREGGPVRLTGPRGAKGVPIITMVTVGVFVPAWKERKDQEQTLNDKSHDLDQWKRERLGTS